jgi:hypothetical protein
MSYATVTMQFVASFGAFLAEHFDVFQAVSKGFTAIIEGIQIRQNLSFP